MSLRSPVECKACDAGLPMSWWVQGKKDVHIGQGLSIVRCERVEAEIAERKSAARVASGKGRRGGR